ncbi:MAG: QueT transporter family protein [Acetanaerobacterium sp.]
MKKGATHKLAQAAMIAALYAALTLALAPLSFGQVQIRFAEALTLLAVFSVTNIYGLAVGCLLANGIGFVMGVNILGGFDMLFGTLATLLAAIISYALRDVRIGRLPVLAALSPVLVNAVVIGGELSVLFTNSLAPVPFLTNAAFVAVGQLIPCMVLGPVLVYTLEKTGLDKRLF